jgi:hypothetical protein
MDALLHQHTPLEEARSSLQEGLTERNNTNQKKYVDYFRKATASMGTRASFNTPLLQLPLTLRSKNQPI